MGFERFTTARVVEAGLLFVYLSLSFTGRPFKELKI